MSESFAAAAGEQTVEEMQLEAWLATPSFAEVDKAAAEKWVATKRYTVICSNGREEEFATKSEADQWAQWGHCCLREHSIVAGPVVKVCEEGDR